MEKSGKVAVARVVLRSKEHLVAIRPAPGNVLTMETMLFADEVVSPEDLDDLPDGKELKASERELTMAQQLIDSLSSDFEPEKYRDEYREKVLELIERKAAGEEIAVQPEAPEPKKVPDLMAALEASLAAVKGESAGNGGKAETKKKQTASRQQEGDGQEVGAPGRDAPAQRGFAIQLEPDARLRAAVHAPAVRQLAHEVEAPARGPGRVRVRAR